MKIYNLSFLLFFLIPFASSITEGQQKQIMNKTGVSSLVFKSSDAGQTWQDISEGLPPNLEGDGFFANNNGLYLSTGNLIYQSSPNSSFPFWTKEVFPGDHSSIAPGKNGLFAYNENGQFIQRMNGTNIWSPIFRDSQFYGMRTVFETAKGIMFIGNDQRLYRSTDSGKTWQEVYSGGWIMKMVESNGILMATSERGILKSTNDGVKWNCVLNEGGVGIDVTPIKGGFAAINYNTQAEARKIRVSYNGGSTWESIDAGLPAHLLTSTVVQVGDNFFAGHPDGIFRSSDNGKTWKLILKSVKDKVFTLVVSGNVIYAIAKDGGC